MIYLISKCMVVVFLLFLMAELSGQTRINTTQNTIDIDLLKAPQSPAATLLGISDSEISRPSDPSSFMLNLRQATDNFTALPASYAVDIAPLWVFGGKKISFRDFVEKNDLLNTIAQTAVISFAVNQTPFKDENDLEKPNSAVGLGLKFSLLRGKVTEEFKNSVDKSRGILDSINRSMYDKTRDFRDQTNYNIYRDSLFDCYSRGCDSLKIAYYTKAVELELAKAQLMAFGELNTLEEPKKRLNEIAASMDFRRIKWKLDFNAGVAYDFPELYFQNRQLSKAGVWMTGGFESEKNFIFLAIARYLYNPDQVFADPAGVMQKGNNQTFDWGLRGIYTVNNFGISAELIYRSVLENDEIKPGWKYQLNTEYTLKNNVKLIANLGRDFNGAISRKGNVIAAINFMFGFGADKPLN